MVWAHAASPLRTFFHPNGTLKPIQKFTSVFSRFLTDFDAKGGFPGGPTNHVLTTFFRSGPLWELLVVKMKLDGFFDEKRVTRDHAS